MIYTIYPKEKDLNQIVNTVDRMKDKIKKINEKYLEVISRQTF